jgi:steroid delta-isomerase-like uncharacterized protein
MGAHDTLRKAAEAFNRQDAATFASLYAADAVVHDPQYSEPLKGREAIQRDATEWWAAFPDTEVRFLDVLGNEASGAAEAQFSGTHKGSLAGPSGTISPTNKRIDMRLAIFVRVNSQGLITEERRYYDMAGFAQQLGLV